MRFIDMNTSRNVDTKLYMIALISLFVSNHITISQQGQKREGDREGGGGEDSQNYRIPAQSL